MNDDALLSIVNGLRSRRGLRPLLALLGCARPLERTPVPPALRGSVRHLLCTRRGALTAWVAELRGDIHAMALRDITRAARSLDGVGHHVLLIAGPGYERVAIACDAPEGGVRYALLHPENPRASDADLLAELAPAANEGDTAAALRIRRALDRSRATDRFFRDIAAMRDLVARSWSGPAVAATAARDGLALLLLSRLMFLYFLQRQNLLAGDPQFLRHQFAAWRARRRRTSFFRGPLRVLFFGVLNRRPASRTDRARALGALPYLNGGLFERHHLERDAADLDLPDDVMALVFRDVLEKYRFTAGGTGSADADGDSLAVDPEMLGRIFEGLMPGDRRARTGSFYTPSAVVDRVVCLALAEQLGRRSGLPAEPIAELLAEPQPADPVAPFAPGDRAALLQSARELRVLDPACGSGAFLLGALSRVAVLRARLGDAESDSALRRDVVARALHGVDLLQDAALICSLRLWLALVPRSVDPAGVPPLPNLDRRIRQGDALIDPLDIGADVAGRPLDATAPAELRPLLNALLPAATRYLHAGPETRPRLRRELGSLEAAVARSWMGAFEARLAWQARDLTARAADRDLFGAPAGHAGAAARQLGALQRRQSDLRAFRSEINGRDRLPFFSFRVHFAAAAAGFDLVLSNPPWVRSHRWPPQVRDLLRERFEVCASAGWPFAASLAGTPRAAGAQVDLSLLFLEKSIRLLAEHGTLAMLLPAKLLRSLYPGGARQMLLRDMDVAVIEDHSLDHAALFDADAFTSVILATRRPHPDAVAPTHAPDGSSDAGTYVPSAAAPMTRVTLTRASTPPLRFEVATADLPLRPGDPRSPWLLVPPQCRAVIRHMQARGRIIGEDLVVRRGAMSGANDVLVVRDVKPGIGDIARIRTEGYYRARSDRTRNAFSAWIEASCLRPVLRGTDVGAWSAGTERHVIWTPYNDDRVTPPPMRLQRYLQRHRGRLGRDPSSIGMLHRLSSHTTGHKVVWSDLAADLRAAAVPASTRNMLGLTTPVIPLNTVYFIATSSSAESMLLAAYLNSLPLRVLARSIAERAKDAHFRFFAWTIAVLPLPRDWRTNEFAAPLTRLSQDAHIAGGVTRAQRARLDALVGRSFGLSDDQITELIAFDAWLRGKPTAHPVQ